LDDSSNLYCVGGCAGRCSPVFFGYFFQLVSPPNRFGRNAPPLRRSFASRPMIRRTSGSTASPLGRPITSMRPAATLRRASPSPPAASAWGRASSWPCRSPIRRLRTYPSRIPWMCRAPADSTPTYPAERVSRFIGTRPWAAVAPQIPPRLPTARTTGIPPLTLLPPTPSPRLQPLSPGRTGARSSTTPSRAYRFRRTPSASTRASPTAASCT